MSTGFNHWVEATPDYAFLLFLSQRSGTPIVTLAHAPRFNSA
jgi:hypothetical protein